MKEIKQDQLHRMISCISQSKIGSSPLPWQRVTAQYAAPVLYGYCCWVVEQARKQGIHRLYFLARDGYMLRELCAMICEKRKYAIQCRYLYASRLAWRMPSYWLIGEEAYDLIFLRAYRITLRGVLERFQATREECCFCAQLAEIPEDRLDQVISSSQLKVFGNKLRTNPNFRNLVEKKSKQAYEPAISYFRQEGLLSGEPVVLVDTGWTGSMQRSLRQLLESTGSSPRLIGYYFGMYQNSKDPRDGEYITWYFQKGSPANTKVKFNNNVLETMCIAPHPMTSGYENSDHGIIPIWKNQKIRTDAEKKRFEEQKALLIQIASELEDSVPAASEQVLLSCARQRMKQLCFHPTKEEAMAFSNAMFCDDSSESYLNPLVKKITQEEAKSYNFVRRLRNRRSIDTDSRADLFWPYGSFAISDIRWKSWYRSNVYVWDLIWNYRQ